MARAKLQTWEWKQAQRVIDAAIKKHQIDEPEDPGHPQAAQEKLKTTVAAPARPPVKATTTGRTLSAVYTAWKKTWTCAEGTKDTRGYRWKMLGRVLSADTALSDITFTRLKEIQAALQTDGLSPSTVNDVMGKVLRLCLEHAVEAGWLTENPAAKLKPLKRTQVIRQQPTWEEAWKLIEEVNNQAPESGEILRFILAFGVGQKEVKNLCGEHIDLQRHVVNFVRQKTGKAFSVPIFEHAKPLISSLVTAGRIQAGVPVFAWRDPDQALHGACERLKMQEYTPRSLRRTFIINALEHGIEARVVAKWQGHRDAKLILDTYGAFVSKEHEQAQIAKLTL
jgi:integrase